MSFDLQSETAEKAANNWPGLEEELQATGRRGLTSGELITLIAYDPYRFDVLLALDSVIEDVRGNVVPCLEPISNYWELSLRRFSGLTDEATQGWTYPFAGAGRVVAPTAKRFIPVLA